MNLTQKKSKIAIFSAIFTLLMCFYVQVIEAKTYTVNENSDTIPDNSCIAQEDGGNGVCSLREAVIEANKDTASDDIYLPAGTHTLSIQNSNNINENLSMSGDIDIARNTSLNLYSSSASNYAIIDAHGSVLNDRAFDIHGGAVVNIHDIEIKNGYLTDYNIMGNGGAINNDGILSIENCSLKYNDAYYGGAINNYSNLAIYNSEFNYNSAVVYGGVINNYGDVFIDNTQLEYNISSAISNFGGTITIQNNSSISHNSAYYGAGIFNDVNYYNNESCGVATIDNSVLENNVAYSYGGAIFSKCDMRISNSRFINNYAEENGGAIYNSYSIVNHITILSSLFKNNTANLNGGAIYLTSGSVASIQKNTISFNSAALGGGIYISKGASLKNIANNYLGNTTGNLYYE